MSCVVRMEYTSGGPVGGLPYRAKFSVPPDMVGLDKIQEPWNNQRLTMNDNRLSIYGGPGARMWLLCGYGGGGWNPQQGGGKPTPSPGRRVGQGGWGMSC